MLEALRKLGDTTPQTFNTRSQHADELLKLLVESDQDSIHLTLKNYQVPSGLSSRIHIQESMNSEETFYVKGPMGLGLRVAYSGVHVAFCAGTGILVFLDLVSALLIKSTFERLSKPLPDGLDDRIGKDFRLHLHVSFKNQEEAIGLDICEKLRDISSKFKLTVRLGEISSLRWGKAYLNTELEKIEGEIKRIWVCGPPSMNQAFDRGFELIRGKYKLPANAITIL